MVKPERNRKRTQLAVSILAVSSLVAVPAWANHGDMPRVHWSSQARAAGIKVYNRSGSANVAEAVAAWNTVRPDLIRFGQVISGGDPHDCTRPENGAILVCHVPEGSSQNPSAVYSADGNGHLGFCSVILAWDELAEVTHELGHCLGLGHHRVGEGEARFGGYSGGIMGGEGRITQVDADALASVYSHSDAPPPTAAPVATTIPEPSSSTTRPPASPAPSAPPMVTAATTLPLPAITTPPAQWNYSCAAITDLTITSASVGGLTTDPGTRSASIVLNGGSGMAVQTVGYPYRAHFAGLIPGSAYTFTVTFDPGGHMASGAGCMFSTPASPAPVSSSGAASTVATPAEEPPSSPGLLPSTCLLICLGG